MRWIARLALSLVVSLVSLPALAGNFPLRVLTYNIWGLPLPAEHAPWRYAEIARRLERYDVIAFQETWQNKTNVVWKIPSHPYHAFGGQAHGLVGGSGLIVVSRYPIIASHFEKFHDCADLECSAGKGGLMFRVRVRPGVEIVRTGQLLQLVGMIEEHSLGRPVIIMGDFNAEFHSLNYDEFVGNLMLRDSYDEHIRQLPGATPDQRNGFSFDIDKNPWAAPHYSNEDHPQRLDYIFYRESYKARMRVTESSLAFTEVIRGDKPLSDHYAITTLFDITTPEAVE